jgi:hypothetical protein
MKVYSPVMKGNFLTWLRSGSNYCNHTDVRPHNNEAVVCFRIWTGSEHPGTIYIKQNVSG